MVASSSKHVNVRHALRAGPEHSQKDIMLTGFSKQLWKRANWNYTTCGQTRLSLFPVKQSALV